MKVVRVALMIVSSSAIGVRACEMVPLSLEQLFPMSASTYVLDTCMQVCSDLALLDAAQEKPSYGWLDALLGKMVRLQVGLERLSQVQQNNLHADDLIYLLAMINRVDVATESLHKDAEYQALCHTLLHTIKVNLARLLTQVYTHPNSI